MFLHRMGHKHRTHQARKTRRTFRLKSSCLSPFCRRLTAPARCVYDLKCFFYEFGRCLDRSECVELSEALTFSDVYVVESVGSLRSCDCDTLYCLNCFVHRFALRVFISFVYNVIIRIFLMKVNYFLMKIKIILNKTKKILTLENENIRFFLPHKKGVKLCHIEKNDRNWKYFHQI